MVRSSILFISSILGSDFDASIAYIPRKKSTWLFKALFPNDAPPPSIRPPVIAEDSAEEDDSAGDNNNSDADDDSDNESEADDHESDGPDDIAHNTPESDQENQPPPPQSSSSEEPIPVDINNTLPVLDDTSVHQSPQVQRETIESPQDERREEEEIRSVGHTENKEDDHEIHHLENNIVAQLVDDSVTTDSHDATTQSDNATQQPKSTNDNPTESIVSQSSVQSSGRISICTESFTVPNSENNSPESGGAGDEVVKQADDQCSSNEHSPPSILLASRSDNYDCQPATPKIHQSPPTDSKSLPPQLVPKPRIVLRSAVFSDVRSNFKSSSIDVVTSPSLSYRSKRTPKRPHYGWSEALADAEKQRNERNEETTSHHHHSSRNLSNRLGCNERWAPWGDTREWDNDDGFSMSLSKRRRMVVHSPRSSSPRGRSSRTVDGLFHDHHSASLPVRSAHSRKPTMDSQRTQSEDFNQLGAHLENNATNENEERNGERNEETNATDRSNNDAIQNVIQNCPSYPTNCNP